MKFYVAFALVFLSGFVSTAPSFTCPSETGVHMYPHPTDPHKFIECVNGHAYEYTCPAGLVFNESIQQCDYTTGPAIHHSTLGPATVPTGSRSRHTEGTAGPTQPFTGTTPTVVTRGHHTGEPHHSEATTQSGHHQEVTTAGHHHEGEATTRGRHGGH